MEKKCRICGKLKFVEDFHKKKGTPDGHRNECKECVKDIQKKYKEKYKEDPGFKEKQKAYDKKMYEKNKEKILARKKEYHKENREKILKQKEVYRNDPENKEVIKEYLEKYRKEHPEINKEWRNNNKEKLAELQKNYRENNPHIIAWRSVLHSTLRRLGTTKEGHTIDILGYSALELHDHLQSLFRPGMSWDNHGEWDIDHMRPVTKFSPDTPIKEVCSLENLQPLWKEENLSKGNR